MGTIRSGSRELGFYGLRHLVHGRLPFPERFSTV